MNIAAFMSELLKKTKGLRLISFTVIVFLAFTSFVSNHRGAKIEGLGVMRVVIDAGHGGNDPGNLGTGRYKKSEKDVALNVALQVGEYIHRAFPNVDIVYTRKDDRFIPLADRTKIANKANADVFISVHCNSGENKEAAGTETFAMSLGKTQSNLELAKRENSVIMLEENYEQVYEGFDPNNPVANIQQILLQSVHMDQSLNLCAKIQEQYRTKVGRKDRGVKQAGFYVISYTTMPSVLTEIGFLTNKDEEDFLMSENGQTYIASAIYRAFKEYKAEVEGVVLEIPEFEKNIPVSDNQKETLTIANTSKAEKEAEKSIEIAKNEPNKLQDPVIYKIQIRATSEKIILDPANFNGLNDVKEYHVDGQFKYTIGEVDDYKKAVSLQRTVREKAYPDAFITAFHQGERIPIARALEISKEQANQKSN